MKKLIFYVIKIFCFIRNVNALQRGCGVRVGVGDVFKCLTKPKVSPKEWELQMCLYRKELEVAEGILEEVGLALCRSWHCSTLR